MFRYLAYLVFLIFLFPGCGDKKKPSLSGDEPVTAGDFVESFEVIRPPFEVADTMLSRREKDSFLISYKNFTRIIPDTVITKLYGKNVKPRIYILKRVDQENDEKYLFVKTMTGEKNAVLVLCFDKKNNFKASLPLLVKDANPATSQISGLDKRFSVYRNTILKRRDGTLTEGKEVYVFSADAGNFILIMTEALDDRVKEIINPIDTLPVKNKFSADYVKDKMNIVSIRDDKKPGRFNFFIHIDRSNGECTGELKGVAALKSTNTAEYRQPGVPCVLQFSFTASSVTLKELEPCGSHRGVKCSFDGSFPKKKKVKKKVVKK
jgi:hypothetical protein